jgi:hypothetical protein
MINTTNMSNDPYKSDDIESSYEQIEREQKEKTITTKANSLFHVR